MQAAAERLYGQQNVHAELLLPDAGLAVDVGVLAGDLELAIEVDGPSHYCLRQRSAAGGSPSLQSVFTVETGGTQMKRRHLAAMGWAVQSVPYFEWSALGGDVGAELSYMHSWQDKVEQQRTIHASIDAAAAVGQRRGSGGGGAAGRRRSQKQATTHRRRGRGQGAKMRGR